MRLGEPLPNVMRHSCAQTLLDLAAVEAFAQLLNRGDSEFLVNPQDAFGIETRIPADPGESRAAPARKLSSLPSVPVVTISRMTPRWHRQCPQMPSDRDRRGQYRPGFPKVANARSGPLISPDLVRIFLLRGQQLREAG